MAGPCVISFREAREAGVSCAAKAAFRVRRHDETRRVLTEALRRPTKSRPGARPTATNRRQAIRHVAGFVVARSGDYGTMSAMSQAMIYPDECYAIRGAIYEVYRELGNGFKEEVYQQCLERELASRGIPFDAKKELRIFYKGEPIEKTYIPDFHCYGKIIVEIKAVEALTKEHRGQLMNYLRLTGSKLGLLVNFAAYPKAVVEQWAN